jgi:hypothetical protein
MPPQFYNPRAAKPMSTREDLYKRGGRVKAADGKWIQKAIKRPGAFTKKAKAANMSTAAFGKKVRGNPKDYSSRTVKQANLAKTLSKLRG